MGCKFCSGELMGATERRLDTCVTCLEGAVSKVVALTAELSETKKERDLFREERDRARRGLQAGIDWIDAERAGVEARNQDVPLEENPHPEGDMRKGWDFGWTVAHAEIELKSAQAVIIGTAVMLDTISELIRGGTDSSELLSKVETLLEALIPYLPPVSE